MEVGIRESRNLLFADTVKEVSSRPVGIVWIACDCSRCLAHEEANTDVVIFQVLLNFLNHVAELIREEAGEVGALR